MPSCESFEKRIENPKVYFVFFTYFYSAVIGDNEWRRQLKDPATKRLGNASSEAFGNIILINNYQAWLHTSRDEEDGKELKTEYDTEEDIGDRRSLADYLMDDVEFNTDACELEHYVVGRDDVLFKRLEKDRRRFEKTLRKDLPELSTTGDASEGEAEGTAPPTKRRKLLGLKKYTNKNEAKKLFGGWAEEAHEKMMRLSKMIKDDYDKGNYSHFVQSYLRWKRRQHDSNGRSKDTEQDGNSRITIRRDLLWDLDG